MTAGTGRRIVRWAALRPVPWRNGQGVTRDILAAPAGAADWLIGLAELDRDAPFSDFPDTDRTFTIVAGAGVELRFEGGDTLPCPLLVPALFPGEAAPRCRLLDGPCRAFNVMVDRRRSRAEVAVLRLAAGQDLALPEGTTALHGVDGVIGSDADRLGPGDTLVGAGGIVRALDGPATVIRVAVVPLP